MKSTVKENGRRGTNLILSAKFCALHEKRIMVMRRCDTTDFPSPSTRSPIIALQTHSCEALNQ